MNTDDLGPGVSTVDLAAAAPMATGALPEPEPVGRTVYVVVCDCGLNGAWVEAVCADYEMAAEIAALVNRYGRALDDGAVDPRRGRYTGFGGAEVVEFVIS